MISTLLLRLSGPMQAWGTRSRFDRRDTEREPSKSGVVGLLCAALGRSRSEPMADLAALRMGVRVDQEGRLERDYHTATHERFYLVSGGRKSHTVVSERYYLADARFLVGLEGDHEQLFYIHQALRFPHWMLFLGRKSFVPTEPVWLEDGLLKSISLFDALSSYPWLGIDQRARASRLRVVFDDPAGAMIRHDVPVSYDNRQFAQRRVTLDFVDLPLP